LNVRVRNNQKKKKKKKKLPIGWRADEEDRAAVEQGNTHAKARLACGGGNDARVRAGPRTAREKGDVAGPCKSRPRRKVTLGSTHGHDAARRRDRLAVQIAGAAGVDERGGNVAGRCGRGQETT